MIAPDKKVLESLISIRNQHPHVVEWLSSRLENHKTALVLLPEADKFQVAQGRAKEVLEILTLFQQAESHIK